MSRGTRDILILPSPHGTLLIPTLYLQLCASVILSTLLVRPNYPFLIEKRSLKQSVHVKKDYVNEGLKSFEKF